MRKIPALLAALSLAGLGALVPATGAQAASAYCDNTWKKASSGYFYAFDGTHCRARLGQTQGNDANWGTRGGGFEGDSNKASSILHKGTSGLAVEVYDGTAYRGARACIKKSEYYVSDLTDDSLRSSGGGRTSANNSISSHRWVQESACGSFLH